MYVSLPMPLMMASTLGVRAQIPANREQRLHDIARCVQFVQAVAQWPASGEDEGRHRDCLRRRGRHQ